MSQILGGKSTRSSHNVLWFAFLLATSMAVYRVLPASAAPGQGDVTTSFSIPEYTVSLHEPVYIVFSIHNGLNESIRFDLGYDGKHNFEFTIIEPDGSVVRTPPTHMGGEVMGRWVDRAPVTPGKTFSKRMLLNEWYEFRVPGNYVVEAKLGGRVQTLQGTPVRPAPPQDIPLHITPRDLEHLKSVCEQLAEKVGDQDAGQASDAAFALSYINDPVAVPYLGRILKKTAFGKEDAVKGLVRIGNAEAVRVLTSNSKGQDPQLRIQIHNALKEIRSRSKK